MDDRFRVKGFRNLYGVDSSATLSIPLSAGTMASVCCTGRARRIRGEEVKVIRVFGVAGVCGDRRERETGGRSGPERGRVPHRSGGGPHRWGVAVGLLSAWLVLPAGGCCPPPAARGGRRRPGPPPPPAATAAIGWPTPNLPSPPLLEQSQATYIEQGPGP